MLGVDTDSHHFFEQYWYFCFSRQLSCLDSNRCLAESSNVSVQFSNSYLGFIESILHVHA